MPLNAKYSNIKTPTRIKNTLEPRKVSTELRSPMKSQSSREDLKVKLQPSEKKKQGSSRPISRTKIAMIGENSKEFEPHTEIISENTLDRRGDLPESE